MHAFPLWIMGIILAIGLGVGVAIYLTGADDERRVEVESQEGVASEGMFLGFIASVETSPSGIVQLAVDEATWLTGDDADEAAAQAGYCEDASVRGCTANGYFIDNPERSLTWYRLSADADITMQTFGSTETGSTVSNEYIRLDQFAELFDAANPTAVLWKSLPFWITLDGGAIVSIKEQYIP